MNDDQNQEEQPELIDTTVYPVLSQEQLDAFQKAMGEGNVYALLMLALHNQAVLDRKFKTMIEKIAAKKGTK
jgi:hypothetical protein